MNITVDKKELEDKIIKKALDKILDEQIESGKFQDKIAVISLKILDEILEDKNFQKILKKRISNDILDILDENGLSDTLGDRTYDRLLKKFEKGIIKELHL